MLLAFTVLLWAATAVKAVQLLRAPDDRLLRTVAGGLAAAAIAFTVGRRPVEAWLDGLVLGLPSLIRNLGMIAAFYSLLAFFTYSAAKSAYVSKEMRVHRIVVGGLAALATIVWAVSPAEIRADPRTAASAGLLPGTAFQLLTVLALLYAIAGGLRRVLRYVNSSHRRHLRVGLRILAAGLAAAFLANMLSTCVTLLSLALPRDHPVVAAARATYLIVIMVAIPGLAIGLAYPIVAGMTRAAPTWWKHWREYHALRPLWRQMRRAFPTIMLRRTFGAVRPWSIHARRYRRACEIRDALVMLSPYYPVHRPGKNASVTTVTDFAEQVREALRARTEAREDGSEPIGGPVQAPVPQGGLSRRMDDDIRWLVELSRAL
ncbi:MAB_1171c family putative transporter [Saccharopolyspora sp. ID03-671]|uniref:MAB_1171c family putative transporter n=1 Tax=Saccharopolyspora sp. ID03-671 TaxID=3073066 RepID=UPI00324AFF26